MARTKINLYEFWLRLDDAIYSQGRQKKEVAKKCGFDTKVLSNYSNISVAYLILLCKELNISADYLVFGNKLKSEDI